MKVWVVHYTFCKGESITVFASEDAAQAARVELAADSWETEPRVPDDQPENPEEMAEAYFNAVSADEACTIHECEVLT